MCRGKLWQAVATDSAQNLYVGFDGVVRMITPGGIITTLVGGSAGLGQIGGIAVSAPGTIYLADTSNNRIHQLAPDGSLTTIAGTGVTGNSGDGLPAIAAQLNGPTGLALDSAGNLYITDTGNSRVRMIRPDGIMATYAGTGESGSLATVVRLYRPSLRIPRESP